MSHQDRGAVVHWRRMYQDAEAILARIDVRMDVRTLASTLTVASQQAVEIAKALSLDVRVLIMDEPTAALSAHEVSELFKQIRQAHRLRRRGALHQPPPRRGVRDRGPRDRAPRRPPHLLAAEGGDHAGAGDQGDGRAGHGGLLRAQPAAAGRRRPERRRPRPRGRLLRRELRAARGRGARLRRPRGRRPDGRRPGAVRDRAARHRRRRAARPAARRPLAAPGAARGDRLPVGGPPGARALAPAVRDGEHHARHAAQLRDAAAAARLVGRARRRQRLPREADDPHAVARHAGRAALRRQPAEDDARQVAERQAERPHPRRADARHRRRRQGGGPPDRRRARRPRAWRSSSSPPTSPRSSR